MCEKATQRLFVTVHNYYHHQSTSSQTATGTLLLPESTKCVVRYKRGLKTPRKIIPGFSCLPLPSIKRKRILFSLAFT